MFQIIIKDIKTEKIIHDSKSDCIIAAVHGNGGVDELVAADAVSFDIAMTVCGARNAMATVLMNPAIATGVSLIDMVRAKKEKEAIGT